MTEIRIGFTRFNESEARALRRVLVRAVVPGRLDAVEVATAKKMDKALERVLQPEPVEYE